MIYISSKIQIFLTMSKLCIRHMIHILKLWLELCIMIQEIMIRLNAGF